MMLRAIILAIGVGCAAHPVAGDDFPVPPEFTACQKALGEAQQEVKWCEGRCERPAYCCSIERCGTVKIEEWAKKKEACAELGVEAADILWPKPNTGLHEPACEMSQDPPEPIQTKETSDADAEAE